MLNKKLPYSDKSYWENRFKNTTGYFDWYVGWSELKETIEPLINYHSKILMVGCGNSKMAEQMYLSYYKEIHNIDISESVITMMEDLRIKNGYECMKYSVMDATNMDFESDKFDLCIDKGTLDALLCSDTNELGYKLIDEMYRVTKVNGHFIVISHSNVDLRLSLFMNILEFGTYELSYKEIQLSFMSEFINSLRSNKGDLGIKDALKNKDILLDSLLDVCNKRKVKKDENLDIKENNLNPNQDKGNEIIEKNENNNSDLNDDKLSKLAVYLKLIKAIKDKKKLKEEENMKKSNLDDSQNISEVKNSNLNDINNTIEENKSKTEIVNIDDNLSSFKDKQNNNSIRRSSCHCYIFKKVK